MAFQPAWAVQGGQASATVARALTFAVSGGRYGGGIAEAEHLRVVANGTSNVTVEAGAAIIPSRYSGDGVYSSYAVVNDGPIPLAVPATPSGSGATRYVIARIDDPNFGGTEPPNRATAAFSKVDLVGSITGLAYPFIALAKITQPASTSAITQAMITDLRKVANPRRMRDTYDKVVTGTQDLTSASFVDWPSAGNLSLEIPEWATKAIVRVDIFEPLLTGGSTDGNLVLQLGGQPAYTTDRRFDETYAGATSRPDQKVFANFIIPAAMRGTTQTLKIRGRRLNGPGLLRADANTQVVWDVEFQETPA